MTPAAGKLNENVLTIQHPLDGFSYVIDNEKHTFVPAALYQEDKKEQYLAFLGISEDNSVVCADYISNADAYNVYLISEDNYQKLQNSAEKAEIRHASSLLVEDLIKQNIERTDNTRIYLHIKEQCYEMIVLKGANLLFDNSFRFKTKEDFLYFLLFSIEQLHLEAESVPVYFLGMITEDSKLVEFTSRYVRDIRFLSKENNILYNTVKCEL